MAITASIKAALVADLQRIQGKTPFSTTVREVGTEPKRIDEAQKPGVYIYSSEGSSDLDSLTNLRGEAEQAYTLDLIIESNTPNADMDAFLDDVRNSIEAATGNVRALSSVHKVTVTDWTPTETGPDIGMNVYIRQVNVSVTYTYTRGSA